MVLNQTIYNKKLTGLCHME